MSTIFNISLVKFEIVWLLENRELHYFRMEGVHYKTTNQTPSIYLCI